MKRNLCYMYWRAPFGPKGIILLFDIFADLLFITLLN